MSKLGLTADDVRSLTGIGSFGDANDSDSDKKMSVAINTLGVAAGMAYVSPLNLRLTLMERLLTDKEFSRTFKDGAFAPLHDKYAADFSKATFSPENFRDIWPNTKKHFRILWDTAKELKASGVDWKGAWKGLTSLEKIGMTSVPVISLGLLVKSIYTLSKARPAPEENVEIRVPGHLYGAVKPTIDALGKQGIGVDLVVDTPGSKDQQHMVISPSGPAEAGTRKVPENPDTRSYVQKFEERTSPDIAGNSR